MTEDNKSIERRNVDDGPTMRGGGMYKLAF